MRLPTIGRLVFALSALAPACSFWDVSHWSDNDGVDRPVASAATGGSAGAGGGTSGGAGAAFDCAQPVSGRLYCDDFEHGSGGGVDFLDTTAAAPTIGIVDASTLAPPSPSHVFFADSPRTTANETGWAYRDVEFPGSYDTLTLSYSFYVERADPISNAAVGEFAFEDDDSRRVGARLWLEPGMGFRASTVLYSPETSPRDKPVFDDAINNTNYAGGGWHRVRLSITRTPSGHVALSFDGRVVFDDHPLAGGQFVQGPFKKAVLRSGIFYLGAAANSGWRVLFDDVELTGVATPP